MPPINELIAIVAFVVFMAACLFAIVWSWWNPNATPPSRAQPITPPVRPMVRVGTALGDVVSGIGGCVGVILGMVAALVGGLVMLYIVIWILKRMWEAA